MSGLGPGLAISALPRYQNGLSRRYVLHFSLISGPTGPNQRPRQAPSQACHVKFGAGPVSSCPRIFAKSRLSTGNARNSKLTEGVAEPTMLLQGPRQKYIVHGVPSSGACRASLMLSRLLALAAEGTGVGVGFRHAGGVSMALLDNVQIRSIIYRGREAPVVRK